jgi:hypothetical protein
MRLPGDSSHVKERSEKDDELTLKEISGLSRLKDYSAQQAAEKTS